MDPIEKADKIIKEIAASVKIPLQSIESGKRLIYISHPYQGKPENMKAIERIITNLVKEHPEYTYLSPVHALGFMYDLVPYEQGLNMCLELLGRCDYMMVYGDHAYSRGCTAELEYAMKHGIPFTIKK